MKSHKGRMALMVVSLLLLVLLLSISPVSASPPTECSGNWYATSFSRTPVGAADGNTMVVDTVSIVFTGAFNGKSVLVADVVIHKNGRTTWHGESRFDGQALGQEGSVIMRTVSSPTGSTSRVLNGTGDLANLHAVVSSEKTGPGFGVYSGECHFDPR